MTIYKDYLFNEEAKGPFPRPSKDLTSIFLDQDFFEQEEARLAKPPVTLKKSNKGRFTSLDLGYNGSEIMNNGQYLKVSFSSVEGPLDGKVWGNKETDLEEYQRNLRSGAVYSIGGQWNEYPAGSGKFSVVFDSYLPSRVPAADLVPYVRENRAEIEAELLYYLSTLGEESNRIANSIYENVRTVFRAAPAAKGHHHFQNGGLLQHTTEVMRIVHNMLLKTEGVGNKDAIESLEETLFYVRRIMEKAVWNEMKVHRESNPSARFFSSFYEKEEHMLMQSHNFLLASQKKLPERDVVLFAAFVHDLGKIIEYAYTGQGEDGNKYEDFFPGMVFDNPTKSIGVSMDLYGSRLGHITLGMMYLNQYFAESGVVEGDYVLDVLSCLSTHHGRKDWGSPTCPVTANEFLLHIADYFDAKFSSEK